MLWTLKPFDQLTVHELYAILQLRNEVFAIEQNCVYPDLDDKDQGAFHLMGWAAGSVPEEQDKLVAYTRLLPPGLAYPEPSIGRVVTSPLVRRNGTGKELMKRSIEQAHTLFGIIPLKIGAQLYLRQFYASFGFQQTSEVYLEDGIEHIEMLLS